jgi:transcriptional regulator with XRE-family HTH domain
MLVLSQEKSLFEMENLIRQIREAAGLNQSDFARAIGRSVQMLQLYERSQARPPADVVDKLKTIAAGAGRADLGVAITSDDWQVQRVLQPGETFISTGVRPPPIPAIPPAERRQLHAILDEILDSGDEDALAAVIPNLHLFGKWVRKIRPKKARK